MFHRLVSLDLKNSLFKKSSSKLIGKKLLLSTPVLITFACTYAHLDFKSKLNSADALSAGTAFAKIPQ